MEAPEFVVDTSSKLKVESCMPAKFHQKSYIPLLTKVIPSRNRKPLRKRQLPVEKQADDQSLSDAALCCAAAVNTN